MIERNEERENRIYDEAIVDAYGSEERSLGWYYYLEERMTFPFKARCIASRKTSLLKVGEVVEVLEMADEYDCTPDVKLKSKLMDKCIRLHMMRTSA